MRDLPAEVDFPERRETPLIGDMMRCNVLCASPDVTLEQAAQVMIERNVGSLVVMRGGLVEGILTERDVLRAVASGCVPWTTPVQTRMTPRPVSVTPAEPVDEALALMRRGDFRHLPVVDHGTLVGIVSLRDFAEPPQIWRRHASEMGVLPDTGGEGTEISS